MFRGVSAQFSGCGPAHAAYFSAYEGMKHVLIAGRAGHHPAAHAGAGVLATICHDGFMTPFDVVKQRMQIGATDSQGQKYRNFIQCARDVHRSEGSRAFYVSYRTTVRIFPPAVLSRLSLTALCVAAARDEHSVPDVSVHDVRGGEAGAGRRNNRGGAWRRLQPYREHGGGRCGGGYSGGVYHTTRRRENSAADAGRDAAAVYGRTRRDPHHP